jgi:hypothetical protein
MDSAWEAIFMLLVLKIPVVYLAAVVWWAIRAEPPAPEGGTDGDGALLPLAPCGWDDWKRRRGATRPRPAPVGPGGRPNAALIRRVRTA